MEFANIATFFNRDEVFDAYTGQLLFVAHATAHDDHTSSGATSRRRTLTAAVGTVAPARRAIRWYDTYWVVGGNNTDGFLGEEVRRNYGLKKSTGLMHALTPGQACLAGTGTLFHAHKEYYRDMTDAVTSADMDVMWNVFCALGESAQKGAFLEQDGVLLRVRNAYQSSDEYLVAEADQFDADARQTAVFYNVAALEFDTPVAAGGTSVAVIQTDVPKFYVFRNEAEAGTKPGDRTVFVAKSSLTPVAGQTLLMLGTTWRILAVVSESDAWVLRIRT